MEDDNDKVRDEAAKRPFNPDGGEDEGSADQEGADDHLKDDQKPLGSASSASDVASDDPHKTEKLTKAGRDLDPDEGSE